MYQDSELPIYRSYTTDDLLLSVAGRYCSDRDKSLSLIQPNLYGWRENTRTICLQPEDTNIERMVEIIHLVSDEIESVTVLDNNSLREVFVVINKVEATPENEIEIYIMEREED